MIEARYEFPYLAQAALELLNAVARMNEDGTVEVWGGHQVPGLYQAIAAEAAGITPDKVRMHVMKTGGGFGRRAAYDGDIVVEAVSAARALGPGVPVKVQWTREDDMKGGRYRPAYVHAMRAGLDGEGRIVGWEHHIVGQSMNAGGPLESFLVLNGIDAQSVEGAQHLPYAIPNRKLGLTSTEVGVPVFWWRSVGHSHTAFAVEAFLDELAEAAGADPVAFRLGLLTGAPRYADVLRLAAEGAGWGTPPPDGHARGIALAEAFGSIAAEVAEVSVGDNQVRVHRVVCAIDCGVAINPDNIRSQIEGGIGFGLGAILAEEVTLTGGVVDQSNYDSYTPLRLDAMPEVEVHIVPSTARPRASASRRAADRPGGRQRSRRRDRQACPRAADRQGDAGLAKPLGDAGANGVADRPEAVASEAPIEADEDARHEAEARVDERAVELYRQGAGADFSGKPARPSRRRQRRSAGACSVMRGLGEHNALGATAEWLGPSSRWLPKECWRGRGERRAHAVARVVAPCGRRAVRAAQLGQTSVRTTSACDRDHRAPGANLRCFGHRTAALGASDDHLSRRPLRHRNHRPQPDHCSPIRPHRERAGGRPRPAGGAPDLCLHARGQRTCAEGHRAQARRPSLVGRV